MSANTVTDQVNSMPGVQMIPGLGPKQQEPTELRGKTAIITGGAEGIGKEISRAFAKAHCRVIMVNRREDQGERSIAQFKEDTGGEADVEWVGCDLGNLKQAKEVFTKIAEKEDRIDLFIGSAGINADQYDVTADGLERHFAVNWLGHFVALNSVYPKMRETAQKPGADVRVVFESSEMHKGAPSAVQFLTPEEINNDRLGPVERYGRSKLAMVLGAKYLAKNVSEKNGDGIYALSVHPGVVSTQMQDSWARSYPGLLGKVLRPLNLVAARTVAQGAYSGIEAATSPEVVDKNLNGYYYADSAQPGGETEQGQDEELQRNLWQLSTTLAKKYLGEDGLNSWDK